MARKWRTGMLVLAAGLCLAAHPAFGQGGSGDKEPTFLSVDARQPVPADQLDATLIRSAVIARVPRGRSVSFFGVTFEAATAATLHIAASADSVHAASLEGEIRSGDAVARPGQVLLFYPGGKVEASDFDVGRLLASSSGVLPPQVQRAAGALAEKQRSLLFWGALEPSGVNARSLTVPGFEPVRRAFLRRPPVIALRLEHKTSGALARATAEHFIRALIHRDADSVADLLNPALFVPKGDNFSSGEWRGHRLAFAQWIVRDDWRSRLNDATLVGSDRPDIWFVDGSPTGYRITLGTFDAMTFITSFKPARLRPKGEKRS